MAVSIQGSKGYNTVARVLVLDTETNSALERLLLKTLKNEVYLDPTLTQNDIHLLKTLGVTILKDSKVVNAPLALWEHELLAGADAEPITYGDF